MRCARPSFIFENRENAILTCLPGASCYGTQIPQRQFFKRDIQSKYVGGEQYEHKKKKNKGEEKENREVGSQTLKPRLSILR